MTQLCLDVHRLRAASVLVVGDLMLDVFVYGSVSRISPEAPIPVLARRDGKRMLGGASNVAANVAALGAKVAVVGVIGSDAAGTCIADLLTRASSRVASELVVDTNRPTTTKTRYIAGTQQVLRVDHEEVTPINEATTADVIRRARALVANYDVLVLSDYCKGVLNDAVLHEMIALGRGAGTIVIVDSKRPTFAAYRGADYIKANVLELSRATGFDCRTAEGAERAAQQVIDSLSASVLLTRSEKGMSLFRPSAAPVHTHTTAYEVFDVSGAGDTAVAAFAAALGAGEDADVAMRLANAAAGLAVTRLGTSVVTLSELAAVLRDGLFFEHANGHVTAEEAATIARAWRGRGLRVGFTNGCFDILHAGHVKMLKTAARQCDRLIVGLNSDASVRRLKGLTRPVHMEAGRVDIIASIKHVDLVTVFEADTPIELIKQIQPDVIFKGRDYREDEVVGSEIVGSYGGRVVLIDLVAGFSTTSTIDRVVQLHLSRSGS